MANPLEKEFRYYLAHRDEIIREHQGQFVVIKDEKIIGVYPSEIEAIKTTTKKYPLGTFLVQKAEVGSETQVFHSRVALA
jgi:hypothetical protein